jgi:hypothetical protein
MAELLVYTPTVTQRVNYIFQLFFGSLIKTQFRITTDETAFKAYTGPKLNYSSGISANDDLQIIPVDLLTETGINGQSINVAEWNNLKIFFNNGKGSMPFDIFSASFYLVSRYEEYLLHKPDEHNRFHHSYSLAFKNHFLNEPLVNMWAEELKKIIVAKFPSVSFSVSKYSFIPTIDIDVAYAHLGRSAAIAVGSYFKALSAFQLKTAIEKKLVLLDFKKDPYDTYDYQERIFQKYKLHPIYFILAGKRGYNDPNISPDSKRFKSLVKKISSFAEVGIHPSYNSESNATTVEHEIMKVQQNISKKITCSRQHFLKFNLPQTYRCLSEIGITDDYSMAYAGVAGFRASLCTPFLFYDLEAEKTLPVNVHSCTIMDGTLNEYLHLSPLEAVNVAQEFMSKVKKYAGEFIVIWHNHSLSERGHWEGWKAVFENILETGAQ